MDERLEQALKFSEYRITLSNQIQQLKFKLKTKLIHSVNGGTFEITPSLISFVAILKDENNTAVLLDKNETPILVDNLQEFYKIIIKKYTEITNDAYTEYQSLRKARSVESVIDTNDTGE